MGSGGPRGLQILLPVADRGRGGFDSHTFPPLARALAVALTLALSGLAPGAAGAQSTDPADVPEFARPDSAGVTPPAGVDTLRASTGEPRDARGERLRPWHRRPWAVMTRSALVPGLGQWTNGRRVKAVLVAGGEVAAGLTLLDAHRETNDAFERQRQALAAGETAAAAAAGEEYERAFNRRATWAWIAATAVALSMLDAYVDAHLIQFDADFGPEPRLFEDDDTTGERADLRVGLRLSFQGPTGR